MTLSGVGVSFLLFHSLDVSFIRGLITVAALGQLHACNITNLAAKVSACFTCQSPSQSRPLFSYIGAQIQQSVDSAMTAQCLALLYHFGPCV